jgi:hypothetical protein
MVSVHIFFTLEIGFMLIGYIEDGGDICVTRIHRNRNFIEK